MLIPPLAMLAGALVLDAALNGSLGNAWALAGVGSYVFFFELGLGPIPWMIVPEHRLPLTRSPLSKARGPRSTGR